MRRFLRLINQNCRVAARLISDARERSLSRLERVGLGIHLSGCRSCRLHRRQIEQLEVIVKAVSDQPDDNLKLPVHTRERIGEELRKAVG